MAPLPSPRLASLVHTHRTEMVRRPHGSQHHTGVSAALLGIVTLLAPSIASAVAPRPPRAEHTPRPPPPASWGVGPAVNVTVQLHGAAIGPATVARVDDMHANAYSAWLRMGSPKADGNGTLSGQAPSWDGTSGKRFPAQCHAAPCRGARGELTVRFPRPPPLTPFFRWHAGTRRAARGGAAAGGVAGSANAR